MCDFLGKREYPALACSRQCLEVISEHLIISPDSILIMLEHLGQNIQFDVMSENTGIAIVIVIDDIVRTVLALKF